MILFRCVATALPQILILLLVGGANDMLGGWNQTSEALTTVVALFLLSPVTALALLITETVKCFKTGSGKRRTAFPWIAWAVVLLVESLAIDLYFVSQLRM